MSFSTLGPIWKTFSINTCFEDISSSSAFRNGKKSYQSLPLSHHLIVKLQKRTSETTPSPITMSTSRVKKNNHPFLPPFFLFDPNHPTPIPSHQQFLYFNQVKTLNCWEWSRYHWWRVPEMSRSLLSRSNERALGRSSEGRASRSGLLAVQTIPWETKRGKGFEVET